MGVAASDRALLSNRTFWLFLAVIMALRVFLGASAPLSMDEAYAVAVSREYSLSFFDHAPLGFWSPVASAQLLGAENPFTFRLFGFVFGFFTAIMLARCGALLGGVQAGIWTLLLYAIAPAYMLGSASILPDTPMLMGAVVSIYWLMRVTLEQKRAPMRYWVWAGIGLAIALMSKYQAALIPISVFVFMLTTRQGRTWFLQPGPYIAALIGLVGLAPVIIWNLSNDWASFAFHTSRAGEGLKPLRFAVMIGGQALFLLPPLLLLAIWRLWHAFVDRPGRSVELLLALVALGPIILFHYIYMTSSQSLAHWTMPGWIFAVPLVGCWAARASTRAQRRLAWTTTVFAIPVFAFVAVATLHANTGILTRNAETFPKWDDFFDYYKYNDLEAKVNERGLLEGANAIAVINWARGGLMSTALGGQLPVRVIRGNPHHFPFLKAAARAHGPSIILEPVAIRWLEDRSDWTLRLAQGFDPDAELLEPIILQRGGRDYLAIIAIRFSLPER